MALQEDHDAYLLARPLQARLPARTLVHAVLPGCIAPGCTPHCLRGLLLCLCLLAGVQRVAVHPNVAPCANTLVSDAMHMAQAPKQYKKQCKSTGQHCGLGKMIRLHATQQPPSPQTCDTAAAGTLLGQRRGQVSWAMAAPRAVAHACALQQPLSP